MRRFSLLTRSGCHLCDDFEAEVQQQFAGRLELEHVQVDHHPEWQQRYGLQIPVLLDDSDRFVCAVVADAPAIESALAANRADPAPLYSATKF